MKKLKLIVIGLFILGSTGLWYFSSREVSIDYQNYNSSLHSPLTAGLPKEINDLNANNNTLFLIIKLPKSSINFSAPEMLKGTIRQAFSKSGDIGHIQVAWKCNINGKQFNSATGFNGQRSNQIKKMVVNGFGATAFISKFTDGYFETPSDIEFTIKKFKKRIKIIQLSVTPEECNKILYSFWKKINKKEKHHFSFSHSEVSMSCGSFVFELLSPIERLRKQYRSYGYQNMYLSERLFGNPKDVSLPADTLLPSQELIEGNKVRLLASLPKSWSEGGVYLQFYDIQELAKIPSK